MGFFFAGDECIVFVGASLRFMLVVRDRLSGGEECRGGREFSEIDGGFLVFVRVF